MLQRRSYWGSSLPGELVPALYRFTSRIVLTFPPLVQFYFRIWLWLVFIAAYTVAIQTPDRGFGIEDVVLYVQLLGYVVEDLVKVSRFLPRSHRDLVPTLSTITDLQDWLVGVHRFLAK